MGTPVGKKDLLTVVLRLSRPGGEYIIGFEWEDGEDENCTYWYNHPGWDVMSGGGRGSDLLFGY